MCLQSLKALHSALKLAAVKEVFPEEVACEPIPETFIIKRSTSSKDKENRLRERMVNKCKDKEG